MPAPGTIWKPNFWNVDVWAEHLWADAETPPVTNPPYRSTITVSARRPSISVSDA